MHKPLPHSFRNVKKQTGFTLVEMAVVLVIAATLITMGLSAMNAQLLASNYSTTKKRQDAVKDALINYFGVNHRLPCPYAPIAATAIAGTIGPNSAVAPTYACAAKFGVIPFSELGLPRSAAEDGWGNLFSYQVYDDGNAAGACPGTGIGWGSSTCYGAGKVGALTVNEGTVAAPINPLSNVVAVIISHGSNGLGAWVLKGTQNAAPTTCEEAHNAPTALPLPAGCALTANTFYKGETKGNDDVVTSLTANDIIIPLAKQGAIKSDTAQVNDDLDFLKNTIISLKQAAVITAGAGAGNCTAPYIDPNANDPKGVPYTITHPAGGPIFPIVISTASYPLQSVSVIAGYIKDSIGATCAPQ